MSADQIVLLAVGLIVIAAIGGTVAYATAHATRGGVASVPPDPAAGGLRDHDDGGDALEPPTKDQSPSGSAFVSPASTRQVARVVAFLFLASAALVVAVTRAWPDTEAAIFTLLAAGMLLVVLFMDMIPPSALGRWRRPAEGIGAIVYLGLLMALTGGASSPFLVGFFLVVAGTALSTEGRAPLAVAVVGATTIAVVGLVDALDGPLAPEDLAAIGIAAVALILLADIATAAARSQRRARDEALRASRFDALTGLYNRTFFFTTMEQEIRRSDRMGRGFTMLMLDLDDLKPVNDTFGHQWGDRLLKGIADTIRHTIRFTDAAARYGGDEFVVLLPETDAGGGYVVGEKLRRDIASLTLHAADRNVRSSVSIGLVTYPEDGTTIEQLVAAADIAMYESKRRGKNRIVGYQTRTERVTTAIDDAASAELVQLTPASEVRTGGDPAPWGNEATPSRGVYPDRRMSIPVQPDDPAPPPWSSAPATPATDPKPTSPDSGSADEPPQRRASNQNAPPPPVEPPSQIQTDVGVAEPWLTETDGTADSSLADTSPTDPGDDEPEQPAASSRGIGHDTSRSDEIRSSGDRPWIALPIEPGADPDWPPRSKR